MPLGNFVCCYNRDVVNILTHIWFTYWTKRCWFTPPPSPLPSVIIPPPFHCALSSSSIRFVFVWFYFPFLSVSSYHPPAHVLFLCSHLWYVCKRFFVYNSRNEKVKRMCGIVWNAKAPPVQECTANAIKTHHTPSSSTQSSSSPSFPLTVCELIFLWARNVIIK